MKHQSHQHNFERKVSTFLVTIRHSQINISKSVIWDFVKSQGIKHEEPTWIDPSVIQIFNMNWMPISQNKKIEFPDEELFWLSFKSPTSTSAISIFACLIGRRVQNSRTNIESDELIHTVWEVFEDLFQEYTEQTCKLICIQQFIYERCREIKGQQPKLTILWR